VAGFVLQDSSADHFKMGEPVAARNAR